MRFRIRGIKTTLEFPTLKMALSRRFPLTPTRFPPVGFRCQTVNSGRFSWARRSRPLVRNCDRRFSPVILCLRTAPSRSFSSSNGCASAQVTSGSTCLFPCVPVSSRKKSFKLSRGLYLSYRMPQFMPSLQPDCQVHEVPVAHHHESSHEDRDGVFSHQERAFACFFAFNLARLSDLCCR